MKKKVVSIIGLAVIGAVATFNTSIGSLGGSPFSDLALANIEALATNEDDEPDCSDGVPRLSCKIWNVIYSGGGIDKFVCETGGEWKCALAAK